MRRRNEHPPGTGCRVVEQSGPQLGAGQVDGRDRGAPPQQRPQRPHLGGRAEHDDGSPLEPQPVGVVEHGAHGLTQARLDDPVGHPRIEPTSQVVAREAGAAVGHGQGRVGLADAAVALGREVVGGAPDDATQGRVQAALAAVGVTPAHPVVHGGQARVGDRDGILRCGQARLDEPAEVGEVPTAPVGLALGGGRADGVDGAQGVGHDAPAGGARRAAPLDLGEHDSDRVVHGGPLAQAATPLCHVAAPGHQNERPTANPISARTTPTTSMPAALTAARLHAS